MKEKQVKKVGKSLLCTALSVVSLAALVATVAGCGEAATLEEVQLMTPVEKTEYLVGEKFDPSGLSLVGVYSDGSRKGITDYTYDKTAPLTKEDTLVRITVGEYVFETEITVVTPAEKIIFLMANGVDTLEFYGDGHIAIVGGAGGGSNEPDETYWSWDGKELEIWLTEWTVPRKEKADHKTKMDLKYDEMGNLSFQYYVRGQWCINYAATKTLLDSVLTPDARYPVEG